MNPLEEYLENVRSILDQHGWAVLDHMATQDSRDGSRIPQFSHTVGLVSSFGHPEIFTQGFDFNLARKLLNDLGTYVKEGRSFREPCLVEKIVQHYDVAIRPLARESVEEHGKAGLVVHGTIYDAVQLILPDNSGKFPWDEGCDPKHAEFQTCMLKTVGAVPTTRLTGPKLN